MRSAVIAAAFALAVGASATVNIEYRADGSIERITNGESDSPAPERARLAWAEDAHIHRLKRLTDKSRHRAKDHHDLDDVDRSMPDAFAHSKLRASRRSMHHRQLPRLLHLVLHLCDWRSAKRSMLHTRMKRIGASAAGLVPGTQGVVDGLRSVCGRR